LYPFAVPRGRSDQAGNAQYPTLYLCYGALGGRQVGLEERGKEKWSWRAKAGSMSLDFCTD
jgi:hypothetical protein